MIFILNLSLLGRIGNICAMQPTVMNSDVPQGILPQQHQNINAYTDYFASNALIRHVNNMWVNGISFKSVGMLMIYLSLDELKKGVNFTGKALGAYAYENYPLLFPKIYNLLLKTFQYNTYPKVEIIDDNFQITPESDKVKSSEFNLTATLEFCRSLIKYIESNAGNVTYTVDSKIEYSIDSPIKSTVVENWRDIVIIYKNVKIELLTPLCLTFSRVRMLTTTQKHLTKFGAYVVTKDTLVHPPQSPQSTQSSQSVGTPKISLADIMGVCPLVKSILVDVVKQIHSKTISIKSNGTEIKYHENLELYGFPQNSIVYTCYLNKTYIARNSKFHNILFSTCRLITTQLLSKYPNLDIYVSIVQSHLLILLYIQYQAQINYNLIDHDAKYKGSINFYGFNIYGLHTDLQKLLECACVFIDPKIPDNFLSDVMSCTTQDYYKIPNNNFYRHNMTKSPFNCPHLIGNYLSILIKSDYVENFMNTTQNKLRFISQHSDYKSYRMYITYEIKTSEYIVTSEQSQSLKFIVEDLNEFAELDPKIEAFASHHSNSIQTIYEEFLEELHTLNASTCTQDSYEVFKLSLDKKVIQTKSENPEYLKYKEQKDTLLEMKESKQSEIELTELLKTIPPKEITIETVEKKLECSQISKLYKTFDTLYLKEKDERHLQNSLDRFQNNKEKLKLLGLPNKACIMLEGLPGCGKTSTIAVIGTFLKSKIYYLSFKNIETNDDFMTLVSYASDNGGIIVMEDVDAMGDIFLKRKTDMDAPISKVLSGKRKIPKACTLEKSETDIMQMSNDKLSLSFILNILDGSLTPENFKIILTTNHLNMLDNALYRPGRMDVIIRYTTCDAYQLQKIYMKFIGKKLSEYTCKKLVELDITPATFIDMIKEYVGMDITEEDIFSEYEII